MYGYASVGLGFGGGSLCGWCLVWAYGFIGLAGTTGFTIFSSKLLEMVHLSVPPVLLFALCLGVSFLLAYKDIRISTLVMLGLEAFSCFFILVLCLIVVGHHPAPDAAQFHFGELALPKLGLGVVVAIFSLVGFESSTAFGEESVKPLKTIPRSIIWSLILTGAFFILVSYVGGPRHARLHGHARQNRRSAQRPGHHLPRAHALPAACRRARCSASSRWRRPA